jgi:hypothetical protein
VGRRFFRVIFNGFATFVQIGQRPQSTTLLRSAAVAVSDASGLSADQRREEPALILTSTTPSVPHCPPLLETLHKEAILQSIAVPSE